MRDDIVCRRGPGRQVVAGPPLVDRHGVVIAHGDLAWLRYRLVLEYEGRHHAEDPAQFAIDISRLNRLAAENYRVIRVDTRLLHDERALIAMIVDALRAGGWRG